MRRKRLALFSFFPIARRGTHADGHAAFGLVGGIEPAEIPVAHILLATEEGEFRETRVYSRICVVGPNRKAHIFGRDYYSDRSKPLFPGRSGTAKVRVGTCGI